MPTSRPQPGERGSAAPAVPSEPLLNPADEAAPGTPGTGEAVCPQCEGTGRRAGAPCPNCGGSGKVIRGVGGT